MGKQSSAPTTQTIKQQTIPDQFLPYMETDLQNAQNITNQPYQAYDGSRLAPLSDQTQAGQALSSSSQGNWAPATTAAMGALGSGVSAVNSAMAWNPTTMTAPTTGIYQASPLQGWNSATAAQYMNPFINNVLSTQIADAQEQYGEDQIGRNTQQIQQRAFGNSGSYIQNSIAQAANERNMNDLVAQGLDQAYSTGQSQFTSDRGQDLSLAQANLDSANTGQSLAANMDFNTQQANNQFGLDQAQLGITGAQTLGTLSNDYNNTAQNISSLSGADIQRLLASGSITQQQQQSSDDLAYNDFVNQRDYDRNNVAFMAGIVNGTNVPVNSDTTTYQTTNPYAQLLGAGIGAAGVASNVSSGSK